MSRAIELIADEPKHITDRPAGIRKFLLAADYIMAFAPDRTYAAGFEALDINWKSFFKEGAQIEKSLEQKFFSTLYVDREQRKEVEGYIPAQRLILIHGLPGTGKTVVLRKMREEFKDRQDIQFIYFDIKAQIRWTDASAPTDFAPYFVQKVYGYIKRKIVDPDETMLKKWFLYKIKYDECYAEFREVVYDLIQRPLEDEEDWQDALTKPKVEEKLLNLEVVPNLTTLLSFLQTMRPLVLCFDNVDRLPLYDQRQVMEICLDLSNSAETPIILAIRDTNLRRITDSGALADPVFTEELERLKPSYVGFANSSEFDQGQDNRAFSDAAISELLQRRLDFLASHGGFDWLYAVSKEYFNQEIAESKAYIVRFQSAFKRISETFVDNDVYRFCNYNIRSLLILYSNFIHEILLRPEPGYSAEVILPAGKEPDITRLRSYFYKWLIFRDVPIKSVERDSSSILRMGYSKEFGLAHKVLAYLYNLKGESAHFGVKLSQAIQELAVFDIAPEGVKQIVTKLSKDQNFNDSTTIWLESRTGSSIDDASRIFLMPAGRYFVETLANSREYAFWSILLTDFPPEDFNKLFRHRPPTYELTLNDGYKLDLIHRFVRETLLPTTASELLTYSRSLQVPSYWKGSNIEYYRLLFTIRGALYVTTLLNSVQSSIPYANITTEEKKKYDEKYQTLIADAKQLELEK